MLRQLQQQFSDSLRTDGKSPSTILAYSKDVEQFHEYLLRRGKVDHKQVTTEDMGDYREELKTLRYSDKSVSRKVNSLKSFFRFLKLENVIAENPIQSVSHPKLSALPPRVLSQLEFRALRDAVKKDRRMRAIVELLLQTGMRISELASLRTEDVSLTKRQLYVVAQGSHPSRVVPLNNAAIEAIKMYAEIRPRSKERTFFLTKSCRPFLVRNIRAALDRAFANAGIKDAKVNDLRHTFIVEQLSAGVPLVSVSKIVGHKRVSTTERYLQFLDTGTITAPIEISEL